MEASTAVYPPLKPFEPHPLRDKICTKLLEAQPGVLIRWEDFNAIVGVDCKPANSEGRRYIASARRMLEDREVAAFETVRGEGLRRVVASGCLSTTEAGERRIVNAAKKNIHILNCCDTSKLSEGERARHKAGLMLAGVITVSCTRKNKDALIARCANNDALPDPTDVLRMFAAVEEKPKSE